MSASTSKYITSCFCHIWLHLARNFFSQSLSCLVGLKWGWWNSKASNCWINLATAATTFPTIFQRLWAWNKTPWTRRTARHSPHQPSSLIKRPEHKINIKRNCKPRVKRTIFTQELADFIVCTQVTQRTLVCWWCSVEHVILCSVLKFIMKRWWELARNENSV